jgi:hypothetical protein
VWLALTGAFVGLGREMAARAVDPIPAFETESPRFEFSSEGFRLEFDVAGTPLEQPFEEFRKDVDTYLADLEQSLRDSQGRAALACFVAAGASLVALVLLWWTPRVAARSARGSP